MSDESVIGCTLDEVSVVVLGDRLVVVPIAKEAALSSGFELAEVAEADLFALGILPRASVQPSVPLQPIPTIPTGPTVPNMGTGKFQVPQPRVSASKVSMPQHSAPPVPQASTQPSLSVIANDIATAVESESAFRGFSSVPVPSSATSQQPTSEEAGFDAPEQIAPAPAPDFSAWPYVDRRTITADDDVPTAQNFLNAVVGSERRGRNDDVASAQAPFGDVPRSCDSSTSDTRAKPENRTVTMQSSVQIGMASLPLAPQPTVVPSPAAASGSHDPGLSMALPEPIVIPAPAVHSNRPTVPVGQALPVGAASNEVAGEAPQLNEPNLHVRDIADSPLARLLAAQRPDQPDPAPAFSQSVPATFQHESNVGLGATEPAPVPSELATPDTAFAQNVLQTGGPSVSPSSGNPFSAPKVGRSESLFDVAPPQYSIENRAPATGSAGSALWSGEAVQTELAPMSLTFGTQTSVSTESQIQLLYANQQAADQGGPVHRNSPASDPVIATMPFSIPTEVLVDSAVASHDPAGSDSSAESIQSAQRPLEETATQTKLSPQALQQVYSFDDENPEDLVPLGVSDRLVLRWNPNAVEEVRVNTVGLSIGWPGSKPLVSHLDIDLASGDVLIVDGPERSGKTALLKTFAGHLAPRQGDVSLDGHSLGSTEGTGFRRREVLSLCYVGANSVLVSDLSLVENIELPLLAEGVSPHDARPAALAWLESAGLGANAHLPAGSLSTSDARIAAVIRTLICGPALVCVDDVTSGMGISSARMVLALLEHAQSTGTVLLIATNDVRLEFDGGYRANIEGGELVPVE